MPTERQAIDRLKREAHFLRHRNERQAETELVSIPLSDARAIIEAWDERNPDPPAYPAPV